MEDKDRLVFDSFNNSLLILLWAYEKKIHHKKISFVDVKFQIFRKQNYEQTNIIRKIRS